MWPTSASSPSEISIALWAMRRKRVPSATRGIGASSRSSSVRCCARETCKRPRFSSTATPAAPSSPDTQNVVAHASAVTPQRLPAWDFPHDLDTKRERPARGVSADQIDPVTSRERQKAA